MMEEKEVASKKRAPRIPRFVKKCDREAYRQMTKAEKMAYTRKRKADLTKNLPSVQPKLMKKLKEKGHSEEDILSVRTKSLTQLAQEDQLRVRTLMNKHKVDPLEGLLVELSNPELKVQDRLAIYKFLVPYTTTKKPELKAIDVQQDVRMSVSVNITSFKNTVAQDIIDAEVLGDDLVDEGVYDEFYDGDNEGQDIDTLVANTRDKA
jgi:hypothetical protein